MRSPSYCDVISDHYDVNIINEHAAHKSFTSTKRNRHYLSTFEIPPKIPFDFFFLVWARFQIKNVLNLNPFCT